MKNYLLFVIVLCWAQQSRAQDDSLSKSRNVQFRQHRDYYEKVTYYGKHNDYYSIATYLLDSTLYRLDSYRIVDEVNPYRYLHVSTKSTIRYGPTKILYPSGQVYIACDYRDDLLQGPLMVFYPDGSIKRRVFYKSGRPTKSHCYGQDGKEESCQPLYQPAQLAGESGELKRYLEKSLLPIMRQDELYTINAEITINEIGQVIGITVGPVLSTNSARSTATIEGIIRSIPILNQGSLNWKPAKMDGVPIVGKCVLYLSRQRGGLYINFIYS